MIQQDDTLTQPKSESTQSEMKIKLSRACPSCGGFDWEVVVCTQCKKIWFCLPLKTIDDLVSDLKIGDVFAKVVLSGTTLSESITLSAVTGTTLPDPKV